MPSAESQSDAPCPNSPYCTAWAHQDRHLHPCRHHRRSLASIVWSLLWNLLESLESMRTLPCKWSAGRARTGSRHCSHHCFLRYSRHYCRHCSHHCAWHCPCHHYALALSSATRLYSGMEVIMNFLRHVFQLSWNFSNPYCLAQLFQVVTVLIINLAQPDEKGAFIFVSSVLYKTLTRTETSLPPAWERTMICLRSLLCPIESLQSVVSCCRWAFCLSHSPGVPSCLQRHCGSLGHFVSNGALWSLRQQ